MKNVNKIISLFCLILLVACSGEIDPLDYIDGGELRYPGKANDATYQAGKERLNVQFRLGPDPNVNKATIYWNLKKNFVTVDIDKNSLMDNIVNCLIEELPESVYNFEIYTYDIFGNQSVPVHLTAKTYGERYSSGLVSREIKESYYMDPSFEKLVLEWKDSVIYSSGVQLIYKDLTKKEQSVFVKNTDNTTVFNSGEIDINEPLKIITSYLPEPTAIDIFTVEDSHVIIPNALIEIPKPYVGAFVEGFDYPNSGTWSNLWDGRWGLTYVQDWGGTPWADEAGWGDFYIPYKEEGYPGNSTWFTVDVGYTVKLAQYRTSFYWPYMSTCPKRSELWAYAGSGIPTAEEGWNNWVKIGTTDNSVYSEEERVVEYDRGDVMTFDADEVPYARYYRLRCYENWTSDPGRVDFSIAEVTFWCHPN